MEKTIFKLWGFLKHTKFGRWVFSLLLGFFVPYSGSVSPSVVEISAGSSIVELNDRWFIRNHLRSIHAIALANLAELASGLAMLSALPTNTRGIVKSINIEYLKKARGKIRAKGNAKPPSIITDNIESIATAEVFDSSNELVARINVHWQIGPDAK